MKFNTTNSCIGLPKVPIISETNQKVTEKYLKQWRLNLEKDDAFASRHHAPKGKHNEGRNSYNKIFWCKRRVVPQEEL